MTDCMLANAGARKLAISLASLLLRARSTICQPLIRAAQSVLGSNSKDRAASLAEGAAGIVDVASDETGCGLIRRNRQLCNECSFAVGHGHAERIGACRTDSEVLA